MCERAQGIFVLIVAFAAAAAGAPAHLVAQQDARPDVEGTVAGTPEALRARLDSLRPLVQEAREAMDRREARVKEARRRAAASEARVDTSFFGGAMVLTPVDQAEVTREVFSAVWGEHYAHLGSSPSLARSTFVFQWTDDPVAIHVEGDASRLSLDRWTSRSRVDEAVHAMFGAAMSHDVRVDATRVGGWLRGNPFIPVPMERVYRRVATTSSEATRACLAGDAAACGSAMGLGTEQTVEQLQTWYTPAERRALVASSIQAGNRHWETDRRACLTDGVRCEALMIRYPYADWAPLETDARISLVAYALEVGGEDAWARLVEDPEMNPSEALAHASGVAVGDLLQGWQQRLVEHRPDTFADLLPGTGRTVLWTLFFAGMALRSTRWRSD